MANNDTLRSIRDALIIDNAEMIQIFRLSGREISESTLSALLKTEKEDGYIPCSDPIFGFFLEGLIIHRRGRLDDSSSPTAKSAAPLTRNAIVKKLRIALDLKEDGMISIFKAGSVEISKNELSALFRKEGNTHYKECSDQMFRGFLRGIALRCKD